ncbi:unnamed protein product [Sphagnum balticum]
MAMKRPSACSSWTVPENSIDSLLAVNVAFLVAPFTLLHSLNSDVVLHFELVDLLGDGGLEAQHDGFGDFANASVEGVLTVILHGCGEIRDS